MQETLDIKINYVITPARQTMEIRQIKRTRRANKLEKRDGQTDNSMTMFRVVNNLRLETTENEIAESGADDDGYTQPHVVRHKDEH